MTGVSASASTLDGLAWLSVNDLTDADDTTYQVVVDSSGLDLGLAIPEKLSLTIPPITEASSGPRRLAYALR